MGVDATFYVRGTFTTAELETAEQYIRPRLRGVDEWGPFTLQRPWDGFGAEFDTMLRYYGPGYERGPWPVIHAILMALLGAFGDGVVFYGNDCGEEWEVTEVFLSEMWAHWLSADGLAYFRH